MKSISPPVAAPKVATEPVFSDERRNNLQLPLDEQLQELDELPEEVIALLVQLQPAREPELKLSVAALESGQVPVPAHLGDGFLRRGKSSASKQGLTATIDPLALSVAGWISAGRVTPQTTVAAGVRVPLPAPVTTQGHTFEVPLAGRDMHGKTVRSPALVTTPKPVPAQVLATQTISAQVPAVVITALAPVPGIVTAPIPTLFSAVVTKTPGPVAEVVTVPMPGLVRAVVTTAPMSASEVVTTVPAPALMVATAPMPPSVPAVLATVTPVPVLATDSMPSKAPVIAAAPAPFLSLFDTEQLATETDSRVPPLAPESQQALPVSVLADRAGRGTTINSSAIPTHNGPGPQLKAESAFAGGTQSYLKVPFSRGDKSGTITISKAGVEHAQPLLLNPSSTEIAALLSDSLAQVQEPRWRLADQQGHKGQDPHGGSTQEEDADENLRQAFHGKHKEGRSEA